MQAPFAEFKADLAVRLSSQRNREKHDGADRSSCNPTYGRIERDTMVGGIRPRVAHASTPSANMGSMDGGRPSRIMGAVFGDPYGVGVAKPDARISSTQDSFH